jgi:NAD(P)-dependent dehydrogenase (short-subunit alcohol dehydrogenase family)
MLDTGVVVTGAASGIGRACAVALAEVGRPVAVWDKNADGAEQTAAEVRALGVAGVGVPVDVTDADELAAAVEMSRRALPSIGGLIHAAGIVVAEPIGAVDWANWDAVLAVNLTAHARITQLLLDDLRAQEGSAVVGIASIEAVLGHFAIPAYCSSKAGLVGLTRSLAARLGPLGIRVNAICPGFIATPLALNTVNRTASAAEADAARAAMTAAQPIPRPGEPEDIAQMALFLASDASSFVTGQAFSVDGGFAAGRKWSEQPDMFRKYRPFRVYRPS